MDRRQFLSSALAGLSASALIPSSSLLAAIDHPDAWQAAFLANLADKPWLIGFASAQGDRAYPGLQVEGKIPAGFSGTFYRNGPAQHDFAGQRYHHWFDGDGMVHRYHVMDGKVDYRGRFVQTEKFKAEQKAGKFLFDGGGTMWPDGGFAGTPDSINPANINILPVNNELWALWEGGSAHALDPVTLDVKRIVTFNDDLKGAPFCAHPRIGKDGRIWNIGCFGDKMILYRLSARGALEKFNVIDIDPIGLMHDFLLTEKSMVLVLPSNDFGGDGESYFGRVRALPNKPMHVLVIDRETLAVTRRAELPPGFWFHGGNAWEEKNGTLHFDLALIGSADIMKSFKDYMRGNVARPEKDRARMAKITIPLSGAPKIERILGDAEFPRIDARFGTTRNNLLYTVEKHHNDAHWYDAVRQINLASGRIDRFVYGPEYLVEEHVFVPRPGSRKEGQGWLVGTTLHWPSKRTCFNILDAEHLADGPVARAWVPAPAPLGFHGQFVAA